MIWSSFGRKWVGLPTASTALSALGVSTFIKTLLDDTDAATARTTLGAVGLTGDETVAGTKTFSSNPILSGGGVQFPATQVPSADANTLDDYEEGSWTPAITFGGGSTGLTYTIQAGRYTKIGRQVFVQGHIQLSEKGSSTGGAVITGLPFSVGGVTATMAVGYFDSMASLSGGIVGTASATQVNIYQPGAAAVTQLLDTNFTDTSQIVFSVFYSV